MNKLEKGSFDFIFCQLMLRQTNEKACETFKAFLFALHRGKNYFISVEKKFFLASSFRSFSVTFEFIDSPANGLQGAMGAKRKRNIRKKLFISWKVETQKVNLFLIFYFPQFRNVSAQLFAGILNGAEIFSTQIAFVRKKYHERNLNSRILLP